MTRTTTTSQTPEEQDEQDAQEDLVVTEAFVRTATKLHPLVNRSTDARRAFQWAADAYLRLRTSSERKAAVLAANAHLDCEMSQRECATDFDTALATFTDTAVTAASDHSGFAVVLDSDHDSASAQRVLVRGEAMLRSLHILYVLNLHQSVSTDGLDEFSGRLGLDMLLTIWLVFFSIWASTFDVLFCSRRRSKNSTKSSSGSSGSSGSSSGGSIGCHGRNHIAVGLQEQFLQILGAIILEIGRAAFSLANGANGIAKTYVAMLIPYMSSDPRLLALVRTRPSSRLSRRSASSEVDTTALLRLPAITLVCPLCREPSQAGRAIKNVRAGEAVPICCVCTEEPSTVCLACGHLCLCLGCFRLLPRSGFQPLHGIGILKK